MKKPSDEKPRNWVKKAVDELGLKPARHKDRKHDYDRSHRREAERKWESDEILERSRPRKQEKRLSENKDRGRNSERQLDSQWWSELAEDSSDSEEV